MDLSKMHTAQLAKKVRQYITAGLSLNESLGEAVAHVDEMERRLEEADSCICWGVDCVHQAKELDKSYDAYCKEHTDRDDRRR